MILSIQCVFVVANPVLEQVRLFLFQSDLVQILCELSKADNFCANGSLDARSCRTPSHETGSIWRANSSMCTLVEERNVIGTFPILSNLTRLRGFLLWD